MVTSFGVSKESSSLMIFSCSRFLIMSISLCRFFSSFSDRPTFGINFNATTYNNDFFLLRNASTDTAVIECED